MIAPKVENSSFLIHVKRSFAVVYDNVSLRCSRAQENAVRRFRFFLDNYVSLVIVGSCGEKCFAQASLWGNTMFMGEYRPALDEKGRIAVPARIRKAFGEDTPFGALVTAPGFDRCIMAFREPDWRAFVEAKLAPLSQADPVN
ncbi:MAG: division/cell wall cluster transcriptional repressor MraZ, partial [Spirochaetota bacterium]